MSLNNPYQNLRYGYAVKPTSSFIGGIRTAINKTSPNNIGIQTGYIADIRNPIATTRIFPSKSEAIQAIRIDENLSEKEGKDLLKLFNDKLSKGQSLKFMDTRGLFKAV